MNGVDRGNHQRTAEVGLSNFAHLQNVYNKNLFGISDFSLPHKFTICNTLFDEFRNRIRGIMIRRNNMVKWGFYSSVSV